MISESDTSTDGSDTPAATEPAPSPAGDTASARGDAPADDAPADDAPAAAPLGAPGSDADPENSAADHLLGGETDAPAEPIPAGLLGPLGTGGDAGMSAAEREYQEALRVAEALGLGAAPNAVDEEAAAAEKLVERLGLDQPVEAAEAPTPDLFAEEPPPAPEPEDIETDEILGPEHADGRAWYVLNTYSGHESRVDQNLQRRIESMDVVDRIFDIVVPTEEELEIRGGQRRQVQRKLLPGYVLVNMILDDDTWYVVRNTPGVTGFVGADRPHPLPRIEVAAILKQTRVAEPRVRVGFEVGEMVRVMEGPFQDFSGEVDEINLEKGKVRVLISMFGRDTPVELDFMQVEKV